MNVRDAPAKPVAPEPSDNTAGPPGRHPLDDPAANYIERDLPRRPTPRGEGAREQDARDALCEISSPQLVRCLRCHSWIKLSAKSAFDPAHWNKHRERCIRRPESVVEELRETNDQQAPFPSDVKPPKMVKRKVLPTPSPTPERDADETSSAGVADAPFKEDSPLTQFSDSTQASPPPSPTPAPTSPPLTIPDPGPVFEEYLARSQRRPTRDLASPLRRNWQEWSWSQLKKPVWYPEYDDSDDDEEDDRRRVPVSHARASPRAERSRESSAPCCARLLNDRRDAAGAAGPVGGPGRL
ncbi:hypothetical protein EVJ58_g2296 [Rhodofomes roseus]|uniref:Uncharacterized protein n=1 Tax=Rhodofomes roseus TaxID=34475 RepID=A0A4Y9YQS9_9APHY|nr:hypothetical protein EVJ58_g2296 [Rhodofomes roseus]